MREKRTTTTTDRENHAEACRQRGWFPGTLLEGDHGHGPSVIRITALGESEILARMVRHDGEPVAARERNWTLSCRDWKRVAQ
ncbi:DUF7241 domain-containing protein [Rhodococcus marinonascens]|uniref:DUF7241 domain-containing protein n=1 Tax=Rhodococcus marinonascens TaxID=38311 RepID=UPI0009322136